VRKLAVVAAVLAVVSISACKKTGEGEYQVEKPVVGTQTDTIHTPTIDVGTQTTTVAVPKVKMDSAKITTPTVSVKKKKYLTYRARAPPALSLRPRQQWRGLFLETNC
jgi:hypothetical protein